MFVFYIHRFPRVSVLTSCMESMSRLRSDLGEIFVACLMHELKALKAKFSDAIITHDGGFRWIGNSSMAQNVKLAKLQTKRNHMRNILRVYVLINGGIIALKVQGSVHSLLLRNKIAFQILRFCRISNPIP